MRQSANEVVVVVEIVANTLTDLFPALLGDNRAAGVWWLNEVLAVLHHCNLLMLCQRCYGSVLLSPVERVVLLRQLKTEDGQAN